LAGTTKPDAQRLLAALCHRCHSRVLLLDGLYATTKTETDEAAVTKNKTVSTGDVVRVSSNPSPTLEFDATKCADSIALLSDSTGGGSSVHQRASKVWGTVLSTRQFSPKTGVHRWAVRLDKCERGHVFLGVATSQGSMRTYVGGDKYGWGMIGTQALWHDRRKVRTLGISVMDSCVFCKLTFVCAIALRFVGTMVRRCDRGRSLLSRWTLMPEL
jgi:hypothetical protein